jgi:hypothetical protein
MGIWQSNCREIFRVEYPGLADQADAIKRKLLPVGLCKLSFVFHLVIHALADTAVGAVGTDNNITFKGFIIGEMYSDLVVRLSDVQYSLAKMDFLGWDLLEQELVQLGASDKSVSIPRPINQASKHIQQKKKLVTLQSSQYRAYIRY